MFRSIKSRLIVWFIGVFSVLFTLLGFSLYHELSEIVINSVDSHLHSEVQLLAGLLHIDDDEENGGLSEAAVGEYALPLSGHYYQLLTGDGKIIARSPSLAIVDARLPHVSDGLTDKYSTITGPDKTPLRLLTEKFSLKEGEIIIQAGESLEETYIIMTEFREIFLIIFPLFFLLAATGLFLLVRLSLKTLDRFSGKVEQITEKSLGERIDEAGVESELKPLAESFNTMMERIEGSFERQRRFLSDASHDLRTPTSIIKSQCDVSLGKVRTPEEYEEALKMISKTAERMRGIINRILQVARLESSAFELKKELIDLPELVREVAASLRPKAEMNGITIDVAGDAVSLKGDRERLAEALSDVIDNAIKYNRENGRIDVTLGQEPGFAFMSVKDSGLGIPKEALNKVFDRFYRVDESRGVVEGSGLGLSIVKAIAELHGGSVQLSSVLGEGTEVKLQLPLKPLGR